MKTVKGLKQSKTFVLLAGILGMTVLFYTASGLSDMRFQPPQPLWHEKSGAATAVPRILTSISIGFQETPLWEKITFFALIALLFVILLLLLNPETRKRVIALLIRTVVTFLALVWLMKNTGKNQLPFTALLEPASPSVVGELGEVQAPIYTPPSIPPLVIYLLSLLLALGLVFLFWRLWQWNLQLHPQISPAREIADIARDTMQHLSRGQNLEDAIIECYVRMNETVNNRRGLRRMQDMTPTEFARRLESMGLPAVAVRRLTTLFERIRYGGKASTLDDVRDAKACLGSIVQACEGRR